MPLWQNNLKPILNIAKKNLGLSLPTAKDKDQNQKNCVLAHATHNYNQQ
jgi:hypothetical protein